MIAMAGSTWSWSITSITIGTHPCFTAQGKPDFCGPTVFPGVCSKLFRNLGPGPAGPGKPAARVRFEDVSFASGIGRLPGPGLGVVCADFDGDGWPDIFISDDGQPNRLWINQHNGTFKDEALLAAWPTTAWARPSRAWGSPWVMSITTACSTCMWPTWASRRIPCGGKGHAACSATSRPSCGLTDTHWHSTVFGTVMADFDNDGGLDIACVAGNIYRGGPARNTDLGFWETYAERNQLLANQGTGKFRDISLANKAFCGRWNVARGLACD